MTLDDLRKDWKKYAVKFNSDGKTEKLEDMFNDCWGGTIMGEGLFFSTVKTIMEEGLFFSTVKVSAESVVLNNNQFTILKPDENDNCLCLKGMPKEGGWEIIGKFVKI